MKRYKNIAILTILRLATLWVLVEVVFLTHHTKCLRKYNDTGDYAIHKADTLIKQCENDLYIYAVDEDGSLWRKFDVDAEWKIVKDARKDEK